MYILLIALIFFTIFLILWRPYFLLTHNIAIVLNFLPSVLLLIWIIVLSSMTKLNDLSMLIAMIVILIITYFNVLFSFVRFYLEFKYDSI